jgi:bifunctional enzyme CysN/CysC
MMVWMDESPMDISTQFYIKHTTNATRARIDRIKYQVDVNTLERGETDSLNLNEIARVVLTTVKPIFFDPYEKNHTTGSFVLIDPMTHNTSAVGMIIDKLDEKNLYSRITDTDLQKIQRGESLIKDEEREERYQQKASTIWITGLHGSGKNKLAYALERQLFDEKKIAVLLDGSTVRSGLSRELDHSPADRAEHLRRVAHVARLLNDQGIIAICSFISPSESIRTQVAEMIGKERFHLVHMDAGLDYCKNNKPELYKKADEGLLSNLPGVDAQYDPPVNAEFTVTPQEIEERIVEIVEKVLAGK